MTTTPNIGLSKPSRGSSGWDESLNTNFDTVDTYIGSLNGTIDDLPEVERHTGTFNSTTGDVITLSKEVDSVNEYGVEVIATSRAGAIGDIWVTKATTTFTVKCSEANTTDTFEAIVFHTGDMSSYGGSVYRRYYVSPSTSITDHSVAATTGSLAYILALMSGSSGILELPGNRTYTLTANDVTVPAGVTLLMQQGAVISIASGKTLTISTPEVIQATKNQQAFSGSGTVAFTAPGTVYAEWWGATGDGSTNDSTAIQAAIDSLGDISGGGDVRLLSRDYKCNLTIAENVSIIGSSDTHGYGSAAGVSSSERTKLTAYAAGAIIDTPTGQINNPVIIGIDFVGLGSGTAVVGVRFRNVNRGMIKYCAFDNISDQAIIHTAGVACSFSDITAINCLMDRTRSIHDGVIHIDGGTDDYLERIEATASLSSLSSANMYIAAFAILDPGANHFISNCVGEFSDVGFYVSSPYNRLTSCRADRNMAHGFLFDGSNGKKNTILGCHGYGNSESTTNTYDHFHSTALASENLFLGCFGHSLTALGFATRYGFYDESSGPTTYQQLNTFVGCRSTGDGTNWYYGANGVYSNFPIDGFGQVSSAADGDTTPSVKNIKFLQLYNTASTTITDFDDGLQGQILYVFCDQSTTNSSIANNSNVYTMHSETIDMDPYVFYAFALHNGIWRQITPIVGYNTSMTAKGGDATGTNVFSATSSALGANAGFYEIFPGKYVPYWTDISP